MTCDERNSAFEMALTDLFPPEHKKKVIAVSFTIVAVVFVVIILQVMPRAKPAK